MATSTLIRRQKMGSFNVNINDVVMDSSYAGSGGELISNRQLGHQSVAFSVVEENSSGYVGRYDRANGKMQVFYSDLDVVSDGPMVEVAAATNLSAVTFRVRTEGK